VFILNKPAKEFKDQIGRGSHWDKIASDAIKRKKKIKNTDLFICESGLGASGFPHIGSFADGARAYAVKLAVEDQGTYKSKYYAYADDLDGLRKVPAGVSDTLKEWIGVPVSNIPDLFECHESYGKHMSSLLLDALNTANIEYVAKSAAEMYSTGVLTEQISTILDQSQKAGEIIESITGQDKYLENVPFHPICRNCGKIYTTQVISFDTSTNSVEYECLDAEIRGNKIPGCNDRGVVDYSKGQGKLSWKVEFAARWHALQVDFEPFGSDIHESVLVNNKISSELFKYQPPTQLRYEMFLDKEGKKRSKSAGNVFTPQVWYKYGSPQSLVLLTLKRTEGTRSLDTTDIPKFLEELEELEEIYHGYKIIKNEKNLLQSKTLFEYCNWLKVPDTHSLIINPANNRVQRVQFSLISKLFDFIPDNVDKFEFMKKELYNYSMIFSESDWDKILPKIKYAKNWIDDHEESEPVEIELIDNERKVLKEFILKLKDINDVDDIPTFVPDLVKANDVQIKRFFQILYLISIGQNSGPKITKVIQTIGINPFIKLIKKHL